MNIFVPWGHYWFVFVQFALRCKFEPSEKSLINDSKKRNTDVPLFVLLAAITFLNLERFQESVRKIKNSFTIKSNDGIYFLSYFLRAYFNHILLRSRQKSTLSVQWSSEIGFSIWNYIIRGMRVWSIEESREKECSSDVIFFYGFIHQSIVGTNRKSLIHWDPWYFSTMDVYSLLISLNYLDDPIDASCNHKLAEEAGS